MLSKAIFQALLLSFTFACTMGFSWSLSSSFSRLGKDVSRRTLFYRSASFDKSEGVRKTSLYMSNDHVNGANGEMPQGDSYHPSKTAQTLPPIPPNAHRFILMRHGESEFNNANVFTGWCDVALTQRGVVEAIEAGQVFASHQLTFRKCYSSLLTRAIVTAQRSLEAAGVSYTPLQYDWRLAERHYGNLQGLSKERTAVRLGRERVMKWRRSYEARPPLMTPEHPHYDIINNDPRYRNVKGIPLGESLEDCQKRVIASWQDIVADVNLGSGAPSFDDSDYTMIVAHANTLRALVMYLDEIPSEEIESLNIPTAIPFYYDIDKATGKAVSSSHDGVMDRHETDKIGHGLFRGIYISDDRKKRSFLERRRTANDPWLWALHDYQVAESMLVNDEIVVDDDGEDDKLSGMEEEAKQNTELFSSDLHKEDHYS
jgi:2,3-bisphosphoglycerate-dependent phosphoglycerate mutase